MEYTLYLEFQFLEIKRPQQNNVKSRKNYFVETYLLNLLKNCVLILQFLKIFLFTFVFHYKHITKLQTKIHGRQTTFKCKGAETFKKDLAL